MGNYCCVNWSVKKVFVGIVAAETTAGLSCLQSLADSIFSRLSFCVFSSLLFGGQREKSSSCVVFETASFC